MSVVHQLAQAVLGVGLLGLVVRLFVAAVSDYQPVNSSPPPAGPDPGPVLSPRPDRRQSAAWRRRRRRRPTR